MLYSNLNTLLFILFCIFVLYFHLQFLAVELNDNKLKIILNSLFNYLIKYTKHNIHSLMC